MLFCSPVLGGKPLTNTTTRKDMPSACVDGHAAMLYNDVDGNAKGNSARKVIKEYLSI